MSIVVWPLVGDGSLRPMLRIPRPWVDDVRAAAEPTEVVACPDLDSALAAAPAATGWIGALTPDLLERANGLTWLQVPTISLEEIEFPQLNASSISVTNMRNVYDDHIANHVIALLLAHCRQLPRYWRQQQHREWRSGYIDDRTVDPADLTVLIQGLGGIGAELARRLTVFGPQVVGVDPVVDVAPDGVHRLARSDQLDELLSEADVIVVAAPQTPETLGYYDDNRFRAMRSNAFFINIGRGPIVRLDALERALREGWIDGAAIDVADPEPLPADSGLWDLENVLITPHSAGTGPHVDERRLATVVDNVGRFVSGRPLVNVVDLARGF